MGKLCREVLGHVQITRPGLFGTRWDDQEMDMRDAVSKEYSAKHVLAYRCLCINHVSYMHCYHRPLDPESSAARPLNDTQAEYRRSIANP